MRAAAYMSLLTQSDHSWIKKIAGNYVPMNDRIRIYVLPCIPHHSPPFSSHLFEMTLNVFR